MVFVAGATGPDPVAHPEVTVEHSWWQRSAAGSFLDLLTVAGLVTCALAVTGLEVSATTVLAGVLALGPADVTVRFAVLRRRAA